MKWEEPPAETAKVRVPKYQEIADELRARPGEWALIFESEWPAMAASIMAGGLAAFRPRGAFEARAVDGGGRKNAAIYARFLGGGAPAPTEAPQASSELSVEAEIRASERERVAQHLESLRAQMWNGNERKVNNAEHLARVIRGMS